jgi:hypothetical protein
MILHQPLANIVPSHLSHSLVVLLSQLTMAWVPCTYPPLSGGLGDGGFVLSNKRKYQLDDLTR